MKHHSSFLSWFLSLLLVGLTGNAASSQVVLSPAAVVGTDLGIYSDSVSAINMINQSGITTPFVSGVTVFDTYFANPRQQFATSGTGGSNNWQSLLYFSLPIRGYVDFDLGAVYQLNKLAIWNRSLKDITIIIQNDLSSPQQVAGTFVLASQLSASFSYSPEVLTFAQSHQGRYVRLVIDSVHTYSPSDTFGYAMVGEVVFSAGPGAPPPPSINVVAESNGDVTVTFSGTLVTSTTANGTYTNVPGNPQGTYTVPKASLLPQQFFRARDN